MFLNQIKNIYQKLKKFYYKRIKNKRYFRFGKCKMCGACCQNIYVRHNNKIIKTEEEFNDIKNKDDYIFYKYVNVVGSDDFGLIFSCSKFDKEKKLCTVHKKRPPICRNYPSEEIFTFGACLQENCGYRFEPIESFSEIFNKVSKKPVKNFSEFIED